MVEATLATAVSQTPGQAQTWPESHMRSQQLSQSQLQLQQQLQASSTRSALRHPPAGTGATPLGREVVASQRIAEVRTQAVLPICYHLWCCLHRFCLYCYHECLRMSLLVKMVFTRVLAMPCRKGSRRVDSAIGARGVTAERVGAAAEPVITQPHAQLPRLRLARLATQTHPQLWATYCGL